MYNTFLGRRPSAVRVFRKTIKKRGGGTDLLSNRGMPVPSTIWLLCTPSDGEQQTSQAEQKPKSMHLCG